MNLIRFVPAAWRKTITFLINFWRTNKSFRRTVGVLLIIAGLTALFTPLTPGSWLILIGLEIFGFRILFWEKVKAWFRQKTARNSLR